MLYTVRSNTSLDRNHESIALKTLEVRSYDSHKRVRDINVVGIEIVRPVRTSSHR